jgi:hypothetical protein
MVIGFGVAGLERQKPQDGGHGLAAVPALTRRHSEAGISPVFRSNA